MDYLLNQKLKNRGYAVVLLIIILVIATAIGMFGLKSSQTTVERIGIKRQITELKYESEKGLQKAVRRIQNITNENQNDAVAIQNDNAVNTTNGNTTEKDIDWLLGIDDESVFSEDDRNPPCPNWDANTNFDQITNNVVCNFLGVSEPNTHVALVRKENLSVEDEGDFAIFLINSIAFDSSRKRQITQGVVVVPFVDNAGTFALVEGQTPYLSNSKTITD